MRNPKSFQTHNCCPEDWRQTPDMTGSFELDCVIIKSPNREMAAKLRDHLTGDQAYQHGTGYNGGRGID